MLDILSTIGETAGEPKKLKNMKTISILFLCFLSIGTQANPYSPPPGQGVKLLHFESKLLEEVLLVLDTVLNEPGTRTEQFADPLQKIVWYQYKGEGRDDAMLAAVDICLSTKKGTNMKYVQTLFEKAKAEYEYAVLCNDDAECHAERIAELENVLYATEQQTEASTILFTDSGIVILLGSEQFISFVQGGILTDKFGTRKVHPVTGAKNVFHAGIDVAVPIGTEVTSPVTGFVVAAGYDGGLGNTVVIKSQWGFDVYLAHLSKIFVTPGQTVSAGMVIGKSGKTGRTTGPVVHFEIRYKGKAINPLSVIGNKRQSKQTPFDGSPKDRQLYIGKVVQKQNGKTLYVTY